MLCSILIFILKAQFLVPSPRVIVIPNAGTYQSHCSFADPSSLRALLVVYPAVYIFMIAEVCSTGVGTASDFLSMRYKKHLLTSPQLDANAMRATCILCWISPWMSLRGYETSSVFGVQVENYTALAVLDASPNDVSEARECSAFHRIDSQTPLCLI